MSRQLTPKAMLAQAKQSLLHALDPVQWASDVLGFHTDPWQAKLLRSVAPQQAIAVSRQGGKTTTIGYLGAHIAIHQPRSLILYASPGQEQAKLALEKSHSALTHPRVGIKLKADAKTSIELPNGSKLLALTANPDSVRGHSSPALIFIDEAAYVADELFLALRPMLAAAPRCRFTIASTFNLRSGFFWNAMQSDEWERYKVTAYDIPRISKDFLDSELRNYGEAYFRKEYLMEPVDSEFSFFGHDLIQAAFNCDAAPLRVRLFT
jgi:hypothetical protein